MTAAWERRRGRDRLMLASARLREDCALIALGPATAVFSFLLC
jgi:hypothetical protein